MKLLRRDIAYLFTDARLDLVEAFGHCLVEVACAVALLVIMLGGLPL